MVTMITMITFIIGQLHVVLFSVARDFAFQQLVGPGIEAEVLY